MKYLLILFLLCAPPLTGKAQLISNPNPPVPAAIAVAGAYSATAAGAEAPYYNPAGLAYASGTQGRFCYHHPWSVAFLSHLSASGFTQLSSKVGGLGFGVQALGTRDNGYNVSSETEAYLSHGLLLQKDIHSSLAFGYTLKFIQYSLGQSVSGTDLGSASTFGVDVGATAQLWDRFRLGGAFRNLNHPQLGSEMKRDLPRIVSAGISYLPYYGVRTSFDVERVLGSESQFKGGVSATVVKPLDLRFGVVTNPNSFSAGFGLRWQEIVLDYAFIYHPVLNPSHLVGIGFDLNQSLPEIWRAK